MKTLLLFLSTLHILMSAELMHVNVGNQDFSIVTEYYDIYDSKGKVMKLYKEERNNNLTYILSHTLTDATGSCADKSMEEGAYDINATHITLYKKWTRQGKAYNAPKGVRKQIYKVKPDHSLKRIHSKLYIETHRKNYTKNSGMKYLFQTAKTEIEKKKLAVYIQSVEKNFKGEFVRGKEAKLLEKEVDNALMKKAKNRWK